MNKLTLFPLRIIHNSKHWYFNMEHSSLWYKVHPNITLITVLIILFATANNEGGIIILITDSGQVYISTCTTHFKEFCVMLDSIFTLSIETEHCLHFANISFNNTVT